MDCACAMEGTQFFAGTQFYALHLDCACAMEGTQFFAGTQFYALQKHRRNFVVTLQKASSEPLWFF